MRIKTAVLLFFMTALILDSRCAAASAVDALTLCARVLIPSLFPLFVISGMLVPVLNGAKLPFLSKILGMPEGSEGFFLLGCAGGFPVGAAGIVQAAQAKELSRQDAERMLGLCSFCGPAFLFGVLPQIMPMHLIVVIFVLQLQTGLLVAAFWPGGSTDAFRSSKKQIPPAEAVRRAVSSMISVCAWVVLAGVSAGFLRRWLFPLLPQRMSLIMTGLLELTTGIFSLPHDNAAMTFLLSSVFICFGGISVLLQISGLSAPAGLRIGSCIAQKACHALLGALAAAAYLKFGFWIFFLLPGILLGKMTLEIPGRMLYNDPRKEGI